MYDEYAKDPRMKLNLGIRRRLAPLLDNGRDEIELLHAILFTLPGLAGPLLRRRDRDGRQRLPRRPRRRPHPDAVDAGDRNGGFSRADFAQLYAPPLMDPVYGYQAVNVEAQLRTPTSLLRWLRRFIALRKEHPVFGLGTYEPLEPSNRAHLRPHPPLRRTTSCCACTTSPAARRRSSSTSAEFAGRYPGRDVRPLALPADRRAALPAHARAARVLLVPARGRRGPGRRWLSCRGARRAAPQRLARAASAGSARRPREVADVGVLDVVSLRDDAPPLVRRRAARGPLPRRHARALPAAARRAAASEGWTAAHRHAGEWTSTTRWSTPTRPRSSGSCSASGRGLRQRRRRALPLARRVRAPRRQRAPIGAEQSNSSVVFDDRLVLKAFRASRPATTPSSRCCASCSARGFAEHRAAGRLVRLQRRLMDATLGILQDFVRDGRDGWELALDELARPGPARQPRTSSARSRAACTPCWPRTSRTPTSRRRTRATRACRCSSRRSTSRSSASSSTCPTTARPRADRRPRRGDPRPPADAQPRRRRRQAHPPPRRLPPRPDPALAARLGDPRLRGRARRGRCSSAGASARRCATSPGCCARSPTSRRASELLRGRRRRPRAGSRRAREAFLDGYFCTVEPHAAARRPGRAIEKLLADLRAREGGLRAALRARQPPRLGERSRCRDRAPARGPRSEHRHERHRRRTAHSDPRRAPRRRAASSCGAFRPDAERVVVQPAGRRARARQRRRGHVRGRRQGRQAAAALRARGHLPRRQTRTPSPTRTRFPPTLGERRPAPGRRGPPRGSCGTRSARTSARSTACRHVVRGLGAGGALGRASSATSTPGTGACTRCARSARAASGSCSSRASTDGAATSSRSAPSPATCA